MLLLGAWLAHGAATPAPVPAQPTEVPSELAEMKRAEAAYESWLDDHLRSYLALKRYSLLPAIQWGDFGRGLYARSPFVEGDTIVFVPAKLVLNSSRAVEDDERIALAVKELRKSTTQPEIFALIYLLCFERLKGAHSFFAPYFDILPNFSDVLDVWKDDEIAELQDETLQKRVNRVATDHQEAWDLAKKALNVTAAELPVDVFVWAYRVAFSRAHRMDGGRYLAITPHVDMMNHHPTGNAHVVESADAPYGIMLKATMPIDAGDQILTNYGRFSNAELLLNYGFGIPENPHDFVTVRLRHFQMKDPLVQVKTDIAESLELKETYITHALPPESLLSFFRFYMCDDADVLDKLTLDKDEYPFALKFPQVDVDNEIWSLRLCSAEAKFQLQGFKTTAQSDTAQLTSPAAPKFSYRKKVAMAYRLERKRMITETLMFCDRALAAVEKERALVDYSGEMSQRMRDRIVEQVQAQHADAMDDEANAGSVPSATTAVPAPRKIGNEEL